MQVFSVHKTKLHILDNMAKDQDGTQQDKNKSQKCGLCSYSSKWPSTLKCHMIVHIGHKDFTCEQCDNSYTNADKLKQHMLTHSGEKPSKCSRCNFSCITAGNLTTHKLTHSGENISLVYNATFPAHKLAT